MVSDLYLPPLYYPYRSTSPIPPSISNNNTQIYHEPNNNINFSQFPPPRPPSPLVTSSPIRSPHPNENVIHEQFFGYI